MKEEGRHTSGKKRLKEAIEETGKERKEGGKRGRKKK